MARYDEAKVREELENERSRLERDIAERTHGDQAVTPSDPLMDGAGQQADDADALADFDQNQAIIRNSQDTLRQVNAALARLESGKYGVCERCGKEIPTRRLEALPYAIYDVDCQAIMERKGEA